MECACADPEKKELHSSLYNYGVQIDICRISSSKSAKKVPFVCALCYEINEERICAILEHKGACKGCVSKQNQETNKNLFENVKNTLQTEGLKNERTKEELFALVCDMYDISEYKCQEIYKSIPTEFWLDMHIDYTKIIQPSENLYCNDCNTKIPKMKKGFVRIWEDETLCDSCWFNHEEERQALWDKIHEKLGENTCCKICKTKKNKTRFHFDHCNMFDKSESISSMVMRGANIEDIYSEMDKCQYICLSCHHIITEIENQLPFTKVKRNLTSEEEKEKWQALYAEKMNQVYIDLEKAVLKKQQDDSQEVCPYCLECILPHEEKHPNIDNLWTYLDKINKKIKLNIDYENELYGKYQCEKCNQSVHYLCFEKHKKHQIQETYEYQEDMETYESDSEDLLDPLPCPCCRNENNWFRENVTIVNHRSNRRFNPMHIECHIREEFNMTSKEYLECLSEKKRKEIERITLVHGHSFLS